MSSNKKKNLLLITIVLLSIYLRVLHLDGGFTQADEFVSIDNVLTVGGTRPSDWINPNTFRHPLSHGPAHAIVSAFIVKVLSYPICFYYSDAPSLLYNEIARWEQDTGVYLFEASLRSVSVLFAVLTVILAYFLGREFDESVGLLSAFFLGISSWHIYITHLVSPYSTITMLITLSLYLVYKGIKNKNKLLLILAAFFGGLSAYMSIISLVIASTCIGFILLLRVAGHRVRISGYAISLYILILIIPALIMINAGGIHGLLDTQVLDAESGKLEYNVLTTSFSYKKTFYSLWDPERGVFQEHHHPFLYFDMFKDYLSTFFLILVVIGVLSSVYGLYKNDRPELNALLLAWVFVAFVSLNIPSARTPRYPSILLPALCVFSAIGARGISDFFGRRKCFVLVLLSLAVLASQPHLMDFLSQEYVIITEDASLVYDFRAATDYVNQNSDKDDLILFGSVKFIPWWYLKARTFDDNRFLFPVDYWNKSAQLDYFTPQRDADFIIIEQASKAICGTGGGPVWLDGKYGSGRIVLASINVSGRPDYLRNIVNADSLARVGVSSTNMDLFDVRVDGYFSLEEVQLKSFRERASDFDVILIDTPTDAGESMLEDIESEIELFVRNGGTLVVLNPRTRYLGWLPLKAKVATQAGEYCTRNSIPKDRIYFLDDRTEDISWTGFYFDYDEEYDEKTFNSPVAVYLHESYDLIKLVRTRELNWPLIWVYKKKHDMSE